MGNIYERGKTDKDMKKAMFKYAWQTYRIMRTVIGIFACIILIGLFFKEGGPFADTRRIQYVLYNVMMIGVTLIYMIIDIIWDKKDCKNYSLYLELGFVYTVFWTIWGCGITALEYVDGKGLTVYTYVVILIAVFVILRPWESVFLFSGAFVLLNVLIENNHMALELMKIFNEDMRGFFLSAMAVALSLYFTKIRLKSYCSQITIDRQNKRLCEINEHLNRESIVDSLTGLHNRRYLRDVVRMKFQNFAEREGKKEISCLMLDIDFFKQYNDNYGHQMGDECLREVAGIMRKCFMKDNMKLMRYGGEEFVVFIFDCNKEQALFYGENVRKEVEESKLVRDDMESGYLTISVGAYSGIPGEEVNGEMPDYIARADKALYRAKEEGRNCVRAYDKGGEE